MVRPFGTTDLAMIFARITRGLRLAGALEERLMRHPVPEEKKPASTSALSQRQPRAARPPAARRALDPDPRLAGMPTPEQIAADIRRRPVGAVIVDICRDLGILPGHKLWRELSLAIIDHRGSLTGLTKDIFRRLRMLRPGADGRRGPLMGGTGPAILTHRRHRAALSRAGGRTIRATTGPEHGWPRRRDLPFPTRQKCDPPMVRTARPHCIRRNWPKVRLANDSHGPPSTGIAGPKILGATLGPPGHPSRHAPPTSQGAAIDGRAVHQGRP